MNVEKLAIDVTKAQELFQKYQANLKRQTPADAEIAAVYKYIAEGKTVIRALESIRTAGLNADGLPVLAIARADTNECWLERSPNLAVFSDNTRMTGRRNESKTKVIRVPWEGFSLPASGSWRYQATVPLIPVHLRPKRGLQNYHILFEAEWSKRYPVDPFLLRRFGGDAWLVVAGWDLTDVERAVMTSRLSTN